MKKLILITICFLFSLQLVNAISWSGGNSLTDYTNIALTNKSNIFNQNQTTTAWWNGLFGFIVDNNWFSWDGNFLGFNETQLNNTIDERIALANITINGSGNIDYTNIALINKTNWFQYNQTINDSIDLVQSSNNNNVGGIWVDENGTNYY